MGAITGVVCCAVIWYLAFVYVTAMPQSPSSDARAVILEQNFYDSGFGDYNYNFKTSNGIERTETGRLKNPEAPEPILEVKGSYEYTGFDGKIYRVEYTADENGFKPVITLISPPAGVAYALPSAAVASLSGGSG